MCGEIRNRCSDPLHLVLVSVFMFQVSVLNLAQMWHLGSHTAPVQIKNSSQLLLIQARWLLNMRGQMKSGCFADELSWYDIWSSERLPFLFSGSLIQTLGEKEIVQRPQALAGRTYSHATPEARRPGERGAACQQKSQFCCSWYYYYYSVFLVFFHHDICSVVFNLFITLLYINIQSKVDIQSIPKSGSNCITVYWKSHWPCTQKNPLRCS